jgi:biopolymer transport protein ExbD
MRARLQRDHVATIDMTPMVDVVFLLIIFFLTTAQFALLTRAAVSLPQERGEQEEQGEEAGLVINLTREGRLIVAARTMTLPELEPLVRDEIRRAPDATAATARVLVRADRDCDTAHLNRLVRHLQEMGVGSARVATEVPR